MPKREDYISWNEYFMNVAILSSFRSKDPSCNVGACIVNQNNIICATGYNGMPAGMDELPWEKGHKDELQNKYPYVVHAEVNAILNKNTHDLTNCILYSTHFPCRECTKIIIQSGINKIYYLNFKQDLASEQMLNLANIEFIKLHLSQQIKLEKK